jgi:hypothetical protein
VEVSFAPQSQTQQLKVAAIEKGSQAFFLVAGTRCGNRERPIFLFGRAAGHSSVRAADPAVNSIFREPKSRSESFWSGMNRM